MKHACAKIAKIMRKTKIKLDKLEKILEIEIHLPSNQKLKIKALINCLNSNLVRAMRHLKILINQF